MLVHGVTLTAELNWSGVMEPLGAKYRVIAMDLCGHGESFGARGRFSLESCADDLAQVAKMRGVDQLAAVGYSMGGLVAQLLYRRHRSLVTGLALCGTARNFRGSPLERLAALMLPAMIATMWWNPLYKAFGADLFSSSLLGDAPDPKTRDWARAQMRRTSMATALSAIRAVSEFTSHDWATGIEVPTAVIVPTRDQVVNPRRQHKLAAAIPGSMTYELDGDHGVFLNEPEKLASTLLDACSWLDLSGQSGRRPVAR